MPKSKQQPWYRRKTTKRVAVAILATIILILLAFRLSPWPGALVVRAVFDSGSTKTKQALQKHTPIGISTISNQRYDSTSKDALLDVYYPTANATPGTKLPVVVWTHGGGWLSGDKTNTVPYYQLIAEQGYVVIALNYSLAPGKTYPTQINQLNQAHAYIQANAERFYADPNKIFLAGDSAGAQLSAQLATIITLPATTVIKPRLFAIVRSKSASTNLLNNTALPTSRMPLRLGALARAALELTPRTVNRY